MNKYEKKSKWDLIFLKKSYYMSLLSKDPSTKVGSVIVNDKKIIIGSGYNGFPRKIPDKKEYYLNREIKYKYIIHAEINAILNSKNDIENCTIYTYPLFPCNDCAKLIIQSGIKRVVSLKEFPKRWLDSFSCSFEIFRQAGIEITLYSKYEVDNFQLRNESYD